jgi:nicotinate-nucleotide adenylyltransferase
MQRLGIVGGTFDPIHNAHLAIAEEARVCLGLDQVLFVPAARQPLKESHAASASDRLAMVRLAVASNPAFAASDLEVNRPGPSYTIDTLRALQGAAAELWFILGGDALRFLPDWHEAAAVVGLARFAVIDRPDGPVDLTDLEAALPGLRGRSARLRGPNMDLSSTELRDRLAAGLPVRYLVPDPVADYIAERGLYRRPS